MKSGVELSFLGPFELFSILVGALIWVGGWRLTEDGDIARFTWQNVDLNRDEIYIQ